MDCSVGNRATFRWLIAINQIIVYNNRKENTNDNSSRAN